MKEQDKLIKRFIYSIYDRILEIDDMRINEGWWQRINGTNNMQHYFELQRKREKLSNNIIRVIDENEHLFNCNKLDSLYEII